MEEVVYHEMEMTMEEFIAKNTVPSPSMWENIGISCTIFVAMMILIWIICMLIRNKKIRHTNYEYSTHKQRIGKWEYLLSDVYGTWECSCCHVTVDYKTPYCPNCGAEMK